jgi:hypothetical protein
MFQIEVEVLLNVVCDLSCIVFEHPLKTGLHLRYKNQNLYVSTSFMSTPYSLHPVVICDKVLEYKYRLPCTTIFYYI